jgi:hypothetical protein
MSTAFSGDNLPFPGSLPEFQRPIEGYMMAIGRTRDAASFLPRRR